MLPATTVELYDGLSATTLSGMGRLDRRPPTPPVYDKKYVHTDVLVVGAGPAGLAAAAAAAAVRRARDPRGRPARAGRRAAVRTGHSVGVGRRGRRGARRGPRGHDPDAHHGVRVVRRQLRPRPGAAHRPPRTRRTRPVLGRLAPTAVAHPRPPGGPGDRRARAPAGLRRQRPPRRDARRVRTHVPQPVRRGSGHREPWSPPPTTAPTTRSPICTQPASTSPPSWTRGPNCRGGPPRSRRRPGYGC